MKHNNVKFSEIVKDTLNVNDLSNIMGGILPIKYEDGCATGICSTKINPSYCDGGAVCTSGIG